MDVLDISACSYAERLCAAALQGLVNRDGPTVFLDYGIYDDPSARRTNEVFLDDALWFGKFRQQLGNQDQHNLAYYREAHRFEFTALPGLDELVRKYREQLKGCVIWDAALPDTANIAIMLAGQEALLPVEAGMQGWAADLGLPVRHDLRGRWEDRLALYRWAWAELYPKCQSGSLACVEPAWQRPEFVDYLVQNKLFTYSLSSRAAGFGGAILLLLAFGPAWLRELLFSLHLDGILRRLALAAQGWFSEEVRLGNFFQQACSAQTYPTIFGWHTSRDDELSFMLQLSANGLRLVPAHLASNFSFHSRVGVLGMPAPLPPEQPELDPQGIYLTFTLSDGDQLMMMSTAELGNWYSPERGSLPFNWETQPLLVELAPALFEKYARGATPNDCLIAGPSGAGYIVPSLAPDLPAYLRQTTQVCQQAGVQVVTFYVGDPPARILRTLNAQSQGLTGYLGGYAVLGRTLQVVQDKSVFISNRWPTLAHLWDAPADLLSGVRKLIEAPGPRPRFIGVHLFAYRTSLSDVAQFVHSLEYPHVHVVRADSFLQLARELAGKDRK